MLWRQGQRIESTRIHRRVINYIAILNTYINEFNSNSKWNVSESHSDYEYFLDLIKVVVNTDIATLQDYLKFDHDERLENIDLYDMTLAVILL